MRLYDEAIEYLFSLQHHGIKLGLTNTGSLLSLLGNPQEAFRAVHIAGTNGKGSTAAFTASILAKAGYRVGLFTSPHLVSFTERIRVGGEPIAESEVIALTNSLRTLIEKRGGGISPTFFEFVTALGFLYFRSREVQWAVVETGMGGRLDATNVLSPDICVITRVGMDHKEFLGGTLREIAGEKAGIIKKGVPVVTAANDREAASVIRDRCRELGAPLSVYGENFSASLRTVNAGGSTFDYLSEAPMRDLNVPLAGEFQVENASLSVRAMETLGDSRISEDIVREGLASVRWEGRCELVNWKYPMLFDGAHNPDAAMALGKSLQKLYLREFPRIIFVIGIMGDKDIEGLLRHLLPLASTTIFSPLRFARAANAEYLRQVADKLGYPAVAAGSMADALSIAQGAYRPGDLVVVTGSFYAVGAAKEEIGHRAVLPSLTEFR